MEVPRFLVETTFSEVIRCGRRKRSNSDKLTMEGICPFCGNPKRPSKKKFYLYTSKSASYNVECKSCGYGTTFTNFIKENYPEKYEYIKIQCFDSIKNGKAFEHPKQSEVISVKLKPDEKIDRFLTAFLHTCCVNLYKHQKDPELESRRIHALTKMEKRNISKDILEEYWLCYKGKFSDRVIIPFFNESGLLYNFQARDITDNPDEYRKGTKYLFALFEKIVLPDDKIYKMYLADPKQTVYICEGILDSEFIENSVGLCGVSMSEEKIDLMRERWPKRVFCIDSPWTDEAGYDTIFALLKMGERCFIMPKEHSDCKDINDLALKLGVSKISEQFLEENCYEGILGIAAVKVLLATSITAKGRTIKTYEQRLQEFKEQEAKETWDYLTSQTKKQ